MVDLDILPLAGELPRVGEGLDPLAVVKAPERRVGSAVGRTDGPRLGLLVILRHDHPPDTAQTVVDIVRRGIDFRGGRGGVMPLVQDLRIGVIVYVFKER